MRYLQLGLSAAWVCALTLGGRAGDLQPLTLANGPVSASATGDSRDPVLSPDGRFVLFSSLANNLALEAGGPTVRPETPAKLNLYLRDRQSGATTLVSVSTNGGGADADCYAAGLSSDGRYALFESWATNLAAGDSNGASDVFVRDLLFATNYLVSARTNGGPGNGWSRNSVMTPDGRFVAFVSSAFNLVPGDTNRIPDVFVRDLQNRTTAWASYGAQWTYLYLSRFSGAPSISDDGRYVAFLSTATNLTLGITVSADIYVRDLQAGTTTWVSTNARSLMAATLGVSNAVCFDPKISADGTAVVFAATPNPDTYPTGIVVRHSLGSGLSLAVSNLAVPWSPHEDMRALSLTPDANSVAFVLRTNPSRTANFGQAIAVWNATNNSPALASANTNGAIPAGSYCDWPEVSADGRYVAFLSSATGMVANPIAAGPHLYRRDLQSGSLDLVDTDTNGVGVGVSPTTVPRLSADGRFIAFESRASSLCADDHNQSMDVFVRDMLYSTNELISVRAPMLPSAFANGISSLAPGAVSEDGRVVVFRSSADNLAGIDNNGGNDVFLVDRASNVTRLVSASTNGTSGSGPSLEPVITPSGRFAAFSSSATDLVGGDTNQVSDVFHYDVQLRTIQVVSCTTNGVWGRSGSWAPVISPDGRFVVFRSRSPNFTPATAGDYDNLYLRDMQTGALLGLTRFGALDAEFSADSRILAVYGMTSTASAAVIFWDLISLQPIYTNAVTKYPGNLALSPDGSKAALSVASQLLIIDWPHTTNWVAAAGTSSRRLELKFSADGRYLVFLSDAGLVPPDNSLYTDVYVCDLASGTIDLISRDSSGTSIPAGPSDMPDISSDGRLVAYCSKAPNIVAGDSNNLPDVFLFDRVTKTTTLVTASIAGTNTANQRSAWPRFSGDRQSIVFQSWASDLAPADFNHSSDIFVVPILLVSLSSDGQDRLLEWPAMPGRTFRVQACTDLTTGGWEELPGPISSAGHKLQFRDPAPPAEHRLYRVIAN